MPKRGTLEQMVKRPPAGSIPDRPGSYQWKDGEGRVIYVGKAKSLRARLSSYFQANLPARTAQMVASAATIEWIEVDNEVDALMLEYNLIKQHRPRFNIRLRDDKSYPYLAVTLGDEWPKAMVRRGAKPKDMRYFGPYAHAYAIRQTLDELLRTFPIRTCSPHKYAHHARLGRPCLLFHIEKCAGPCVGEVTKADYMAMVDELIGFLDGNTAEVLKRMEAEMKEAASELDFERAARMRDRLHTVQKAIARQQMVTDKPEDLDVVGIEEDELEAAVQVFHVRRGRVVGRKGFIVDKVEELDRPALVAHVLGALYADAPMGVPRTVLVPDEPEDVGTMVVYLEAKRAENPATYEAGGVSPRGQGRPSSRVDIRVPQRGDKKDLLETVTRNAREEFQRHRLKRASDHNARARALNALQDALDLPEPPLRIECFDMSHIQGSDYVGSMVVMEDGIAKPKDYRRFKVRTVEGNDDFASMEEVVRRRMQALLDERAKPVGERPGKFAYPPQLLLIDGGKGQLSRAVKVLEDLGLEGEIPVASLAKQFEEVYVPGRADPIRISRTSESLYLLQRIRDEAHRFAITYHRHLRGKRMTKSTLDSVPGLGPGRQKRLLAHFGTIKAMRAAVVEDFLALSWLPDKVARDLYLHLHPPKASAATNVATSTTWKTTAISKTAAD